MRYMKWALGITLCTILSTPVFGSEPQILKSAWERGECKQETEIVRITDEHRLRGTGYNFCIKEPFQNYAVSVTYEELIFPMPDNDWKPPQPVMLQPPSKDMALPYRTIFNLERTTPQGTEVALFVTDMDMTLLHAYEGKGKTLELAQQDLSRNVVMLKRNIAEEKEQFYTALLDWVRK